LHQHTAYIAFGANLGDKLATCREAMAALGATDGIRLLAQSPFYRTEPVDYLDQAWFVNAVAGIETRLQPLDLLAALQAIETAAGRTRGGAARFGPRTLDLDILFYDALVLDTPELVLPHPRMHKRRFVLKPMCDINPQFLHPVLQRNVQDLLDSLAESGQGVFRIQCDC
jgi:2-amino-4-hydroxy-6-hydroxymethyldihydropteridine diphosphokinase